jgi:CTP synthase (UTP-ammonia lyase)
MTAIEKMIKFDVDQLYNIEKSVLDYENQIDDLLNQSTNIIAGEIYASMWNETTEKIDSSQKQIVKNIIDRIKYKSESLENCSEKFDNLMSQILPATCSFKEVYNFIDCISQSQFSTMSFKDFEFRFMQTLSASLEKHGF